MSTPPRAVVFVLLIVLTWGLFLRRYMRTGGDQHRPEAPQIPQDQAAGIEPGEGCRKAPFLEQLAALAEENDIVELRLLHGSRTVTAGSSSDFTPQKGFFR